MKGLVSLFLLISPSVFPHILYCDGLLQPPSHKGDVSSANPAERMRAAGYIGESVDKRAFDAAILLLDDKDQNVRAWAAWALGEIGDKRAIQQLIACLTKRPKGSDVESILERKWLNAVFHALPKLTGQDFGFDSQKWIDWHAQKGKGQAPPGN